jgi:predicted aconitase
LQEIARLASLVSGRATTVPFYVNTGRDVLVRAQDEGHARVIEEFGASFVTDTCTYITPIIHDLTGAVLTNSGKWAHYAPGNLGVEVVLASLTDCVESAVSGEVMVRGLE